MQVYKTKWFARWAEKEGVTDPALWAAVDEMNSGLIDANLGGTCTRSGSASMAGARAAVCGPCWRSGWGIGRTSCLGSRRMSGLNVSAKELQALKLLAAKLLGYDARTLAKALAAGELYEVESDG